LIRKTKLMFLFLILVASSSAAFGVGLQTVDLGLDDTVPITLNLKNADVTDVFRLLAEQNNLNIVVSPTVNGTISLRLSNVLLEEAFAVILDAAGARIEKSQNIFHIYALGELQRIEEIKEEMITEIFSLNFIDTSALQGVIEEFLSADGKTRTFNRARKSYSSGKPPMLIVVDYPQNIETIRKLIEKLDVETPQVLIDAKIVETSKDTQDVLGTEWNLQGAFSGSPVSMDTVYSTSGEISYGVLSFDGISGLWQRISEDKANNVLSDARLMTLDNETARIHVGETIPVGVNSLAASAGGSVAVGTTGVEEWDVGVSVNVTPHVLDSNVIMMHVMPEVSNVKEFSSLGGTGASDAPITTERTVDTNIMIRSGETIVIGGLVQDSDTERKTKVPVLGELPVVGSLFRKKELVKTKTNLIIFITARLMELRSRPPVTGNELTPPMSTTDPAKKSEPLGEFLEYK